MPPPRNDEGTLRPLAMTEGLRPRAGTAAVANLADGGYNRRAMEDTLSPIGVVVVSYNTAPLLRRCLASLQQCALPLRIVVVDNGSRDESAALVRREFPAVMVRERPDNPGYAAACNEGIALLAETCGAILVLNPDTEVLPGAIEAMAAFLAAHPRVGLVGPRLLNPDRTLQRAAFRFPDLISTALDLFPPGEVLPGRLYDSWWHGRYPAELGNEPFPIDYPLGACMLVRSATIAEVGGMDEGYFMYCEEVDWCRRIKQAGWAIWQTPAAQVIHVGGAATGQFRWRMQVALWQARARYMAKFASPATQRAFQILVTVGMLRLMGQAWRKYVIGQIDRDTLRSQLLAYSMILGKTGHFAAVPVAKAAR
ncbi:glycosyltransferase family 2 protein [Chloroflexus sp.]|uniref:glycosyltransferase family 2 protein n=1 Tax=Chloroflexus sp. TaxID=1904827 RepID=UPI00298F0A77|nr:glycosyltransferase family 2 protein [Chloroflexus sp.]MDW8406002.1 glycosyltransferase family 2 protein [Chloroflexus sp.]